MKIWLYSHLVDSPGNRLFFDEATRRGHEVVEVRPDLTHWPLSGSTEERPDLVFTRSGSSSPANALPGLITLEQAGLLCINSSQSLLFSRDKAISYSLLARAGVPVPRSVYLGRGPVGEAAAQIPGPPWIVKLPVSTKGQGIVLVESMRSLRSLVDTLHALDQTMILQEFVASAAGCDTRVLVLGGQAVVAAKRQAGQGDEFRSNLFLGGQATGLELSSQWRLVAEKAAETLGLEVAGVDLLEGPAGPLVVEVNGSPGMTAASDIAPRIVSYLEGRC
ncbi:MAG: RimK family alpha-L-glutamate ligase [Vulcanimicrobiota bacterium]